MQEVLTILGPTPYPPGNTTGSVREWCINSGAIDPFSASALANSEDGTMYRWSFASNSFVQQVTLTTGEAEAYTPTAVGADGAAYAINDATLFAIGQASNLIVSSSHGYFTQGQTGATYTLTAANNGSAATEGIVTVGDTLPSGLTATAIGGLGWVCTEPAGPCTRSDPLAAGGSYPALTLTVNVAAGAPTPAINTAEVSSDGAPNSVNFVASDSTVIYSAALSIAKSHSGNFMQGEAAATYSVTVSNASSPGPTSGTVTVTETPPMYLSLVSMQGTGWLCPSPSGQNTCTRSDPLGAGASYATIPVTVSVAFDAPASAVNQVSVMGGGSAPANASDTATVISACDVDGHGTVTVADVQTLIDEALGTATAANDLNADGTVNVVDIQIAIDAALGLGCAAS